jgi:hypothetical protein
VSLGAVAEDGREFYAVSTEFDAEAAHPWVKRNVLPQLPPPGDPAWMPREQLREALLEFLGDEPVLWAWYGGVRPRRAVPAVGLDARAAPGDPALHDGRPAAVGAPRPAGAAAAGGRACTTPSTTRSTRAALGSACRAGVP